MEKCYDYQELIRAIRDGQMMPERSGEYWGDEEKEKVVQLYHSGMGISEIALELQRSEMAVIQRLLTENLLTPPGATRRRTPKEPRCLCEDCELRKQCKKGNCLKGGA